MPRTWFSVRMGPVALSILLTLALPATPARAEQTGPSTVFRDALPALGIGETFGRWNREVKLVYDPDGAPARFASTSTTLDLIQEAVDAWTTVSGIHMTLVGADSGVPDDSNATPEQQDGLVRINWTVDSGFAGRAGPDFDRFDSSLGYSPYADGAVELSDSADSWRDEQALVDVLVHEFGHLLGLGHSDNPQSVMFANPYNHLRHPREDDIRAMQALYGPPALAIDPALPQARWQFVAPQTASASVTARLFKATQFGDAAHFAVDEVKVGSIDDATAPGTWLWINLGGVQNESSSAVRHDTTVYLVDPFGYVYAEAGNPIECPANSICGFRSLALVTFDMIRTVPGTWRAVVVDTDSNRTLLALTLPVATTVTMNQPPVATLSLTGGSNASASVALEVTDPEGRPVSVTWVVPGQNEVTQQVASGQSVTRSFNFPQAVPQTFYVVLRDPDNVYDFSIPGSDSPGRGFQTLLRASVALPLGGSTTGLSVVSSNGGSVGSGTGGAVLAREVLDRVSNTPEQGGTCLPLLSCGGSFRMGASSDEGLSQRTSFSSGESVVVAGAVGPRSVDLNKPADIFIVLRTGDGAGETWTYRDIDGVFRPWNTQVADLQPAYEVTSLQASESFAMYSGSLGAATQRLYIGYMTTDANVLYFTGNALRLEVSE